MISKLKFIALFISIIFTTVSMTNVPETHIIILNVDTALINSGNIAEVCSFSPEQDIEITEYNTEVRVHDIVIWRGLSSVSPDGDTVMITSINHEGGVRVFDRNVLRDSNQNPGVVIGTVKQGRAGDEEKYKVSFKVFNNGVQRGGTYHIDPKIKITN